MSLLNTTLQTLVVRLRDLGGNVTQQKVHNRIFEAYEAKSLVFEAITAEQQAVMAQFKGVIPPQHPVGQPFVIENWNELKQVHSDSNIYQLLPRRAKTNASYTVMRAICMSHSSPFTMEHRVDPLDYKMVFRAADSDFRNQFNTTSPDKIGTNIWFDGILKGPKDTGLIMCHNSLSPTNITNLAGTVLFLREFAKQPSDGDRHRHLKDLWGALLQNRTHVFIGTTSAAGRDILHLAKTKSVFVYGKKGAQYNFLS